jgi:hypothetical protein
MRDYGSFSRWPQPIHVLALLLTISGLQPVIGQTRPRDAGPNFRLTLTSQAVGQDEGWCTFSVEVLNDSGGVSHRCGSAPQRRTLSKAECELLRELYLGAGLFDGGHIGADHSGTDFPFQMLIVRPVTGMTPPAVVLVITGNATFSRGPRKSLLDWLINTRATLTKR